MKRPSAARAGFTTERFCLGVGVSFWVGAALCLFAVASHRDLSSVPGRASLAGYFLGPTTEIAIRDATSRLRKNDPVFFQASSGTWRQVGYVSRVPGEASGETIRIAWYDTEVAADQCQLVHYRNSGRLDDVVATMLPPDKRQRIQDRIAAALTLHGEELSAAFVPLVQKTMRRSLPVIEEEFRLAVERHRQEIDQIADRWNDEVVSERLIPLAKREIIPIVRKHGQPPAEEIGRELWDRASIWRFGWRAIYDKTPLPRKDLLQAEWERFVELEAVPVFEARMDDIVVAVQRMLADVAANSAVRSELADVANKLASDPEARQLVRDVLKETLVENERLREVWSEVWNSDEARGALDMAGDRLEPVVRSIGDELFGTKESGIDPNFARVLRSQILGKDRQWVVAVISDDPDSDAIRYSAESMPYPVVYMADQIVGTVGDGDPSP